MPTAAFPRFNGTHGKGPAPHIVGTGPFKNA